MSSFAVSIIFDKEQPRYKGQYMGQIMKVGLS